MKIDRRSVLAATAAGTVLLLLTACGANNDPSGGGEGFPERGVTVIAAGSPGGGLDTAARTLESGFKDAGISQKLTIQNKGGGGGNPARAALLKGPNDGYTVVAESDRIYLAPLTGTTEMTLDDFTPIAQLTSDYEVWIVKADSKFQSAKQVLDSVKENPKSVSFGVGTTPSDDQFNILNPAKQYGVEDIKALNVVAFKEGGDLNTELLGGHVDVASTGLSEATELVRSGKFRLLAVSAPEPLDGVAEGIPTWQDQGLDVTISHWRGLFGPAEMPEEARKWWEQSVKEAVESDEFQEKTANLNLTADFKTGQDFLTEVIEPERKSAEALIEELGLGG